MLARGMKRSLWVAGLLVGLGVVTAACGASTQAGGVALPTLTPSPSPTATSAPTAVATAMATTGGTAGCGANPYFENPPGPLPTTIPLPPGTLVANLGEGIQAGSVNYNVCTPSTTPAAITAYMDSALPAAGWLRNSVAACDHVQGYPWYKGQYGMEIDVGGDPSAPDTWSLQICPHVGQG